MATESAHEGAPGQIHVHCGPYNDQDRVMQVGKQIIEKLKYWCQRGHIIYRMGDDRGILYKLEVPKLPPPQAPVQSQEVMYTPIK